MSAKKAYKCIVRPAGQITHEVPKDNVCAKEIVLLRHIHGSDAVIRIQEVGAFEHYDEEGMLRHLAEQYGVALVQKVFNTMILEQHDQEENVKYVPMVRIEAEARNADLQEVFREAGPAQPAPNTPDTGPLYTGDELTNDEVRSLE